MDASISEKTAIHAIPASSLQSNKPKSTITKRNTKAKKGLGAKKVGGLGAHKVTKVDFETLEKNAEEEEKAQKRLSVSSDVSDRLKEGNDESSTQSLRLAYQDLSVKEKQDNLKLNKMSETKKEQAQRLGMGMGRTDDVSHSIGMVTIDQVNPTKKSGRRGRYEERGDVFFDAYSSSKNRKYRWDESDSSDDDGHERVSGSSKYDFSYKSTKGSSVDKEPETITVTPIGDDRHRGSGMFMVSATTTAPKQNRQRNVKKGETERGKLPDKYSSAQSISSDQLFGTDRSEPEHQERMRNLGNQSSISSDQYFGRSATSRQSSQHMPEVGDIKEGVREGVRSVAGKLSSMASGLANTIQDRYG